MHPSPFATIGPTSPLRRRTRVNEPNCLPTAGLDGGSDETNDRVPWSLVDEQCTMDTMSADRPSGTCHTDVSLELNECWALLRDEDYGRLAVAGEDGPDIFPINVRVDHATIVFRSAAGSKLAALRREPRVAFEVDGHDDVDGTAWSVVIRGIARVVSNQYDALEVVELGVTPWQRGPKPEFVRIEPTTVSGRRFQRSQRSEWSVPEVHRTNVDD